MEINLKKEMEKVEHWKGSERADIITDGRGIVYKDACVYSPDGDATLDKVRIITANGETSGYLVLLGAFYDETTRKDIKHYLMENDGKAKEALLTYEKSLPKGYGDTDEYKDERYVFLMKGYIIVGNTHAFIEDIISMVGTATKGKKTAMVLPESAADITDEMKKCTAKTVKPILFVNKDKEGANPFILADIT